MHPRAMSDTATITQSQQDQRLARRWHVILCDDDAHSYEYVVSMLMEIFGHSLEQAFAMAVEVDSQGTVIVTTTSYERALLKQEQIHDYGPDPRIPDCQGSMTAVVEPAPM